MHAGGTATSGFAFLFSFSSAVRFFAFLFSFLTGSIFTAFPDSATAGAHDGEAAELCGL